eukprot:gene27350-biopygen17839
MSPKSYPRHMMGQSDCGTVNS